MNSVINLVLPIISVTLIALGYTLSVKPNEFGKKPETVVTISIIIMILGTVGLLVSIFI